MVRPGARNLITDVAGLNVGHAEDRRVATGVTALIADASAAAVCDIRGGAPGTRDVAALDAAALVGQVDAIVLAGGSAFGLDASAGVTQVLRAQGRGFRIAPSAPPVPIVPAAILFDLANGGDKNWGGETPYRLLGAEAARAASADFALGTVGAGFGAVSGRLKGGIGSVSAVTAEGIALGALVAANAVGSAVIPGTDAFWAFPFEQNEEFGGRRPTAVGPVPLDLPTDMKIPRAGENTTIAIVATDAALDRAELARIAVMAADGFARALRPVHTPFDGDLVFALSTAKQALKGMRQHEVLRLGSIAADCIARAIARGIYEATSFGSVKSYRDTFQRG